MTETNNSNKHNRVKNPDWSKANQLSIYKLEQGFELGTIENKSRQQSGQNLDRGLWNASPFLSLRSFAAINEPFKSKQDSSQVTLFPCRDGSRRDFERSESHSKKRQSSTEGNGHSSQQQSTTAPMSPHSKKVSPRFSPRQQSPRAWPASPPSSTSSAVTQPLLVVTSQSTSSSNVPSVSSSDDGILASKQRPLLTVCSTPSQSVPGYGPVLGNKLKDGTGRPTLISSLSTHEGLQRKVVLHSMWKTSHVAGLSLRFQVAG